MKYKIKLYQDETNECDFNGYYVHEFDNEIKTIEYKYNDCYTLAEQSFGRYKIVEKQQKIKLVKIIKNEVLFSYEINKLLVSGDVLRLDFSGILK